MTNLNNNDQATREVLEEAHIIALVGYSTDPNSYSNEVGEFLRSAGYTVYPVNPTVKSINGHHSYASLKEIPEHIDIVDVFRGSKHLAGIVEEAIEVKAGTVWAQIGVIDGAARDRALEAGLNFSMNRCIMMETVRLFGE
ncbi:MAG TPA: CoA-binding protein [Phototrophicaceae bacterium]|jgi:hypothetical protein|nr:CoA-binding protein [Phototrophicaceae bacterium]